MGQLEVSSCNSVDQRHCPDRPRAIVQRYQPLAKFGSYHAVIGSWVIGNRACGMGIREDTSLITQDTSRFVPHVIL
jgi:glutathionylspermidine synthase